MWSRQQKRQLFTSLVLPILDFEKIYVQGISADDVVAFTRTDQGLSLRFVAMMERCGGGENVEKQFDLFTRWLMRSLVLTHEALTQCEQSLDHNNHNKSKTLDPLFGGPNPPFMFSDVDQTKVSKSLSSVVQWMHRRIKAELGVKGEEDGYASDMDYESWMDDEENDKRVQLAMQQYVANMDEEEAKERADNNKSLSSWDDFSYQRRCHCRPLKQISETLLEAPTPHDDLWSMFNAAREMLHAVEGFRWMANQPYALSVAELTEFVEMAQVHAETESTETALAAVTNTLREATAKADSLGLSGLVTQPCRPPSPLFPDNKFDLDFDKN